jgi:hypothetical protein
MVRLYNDLARHRLNDTTGAGSFDFPTLKQGTDLVMAFRFQARIDGEYIETPRDVLGVTATISKVDARPTAGTFRLTTGVSTTAALDYNASAAAFQTGMATLYGAVALETVLVDGSWLVLFSGEIDDPSVRENVLSPSSFLRWTKEEQADGTWLYEFRAVQAPVAFTDTFERTLPEGPKVEIVQEGASVDGVLIPEIQALRLDPWFAGVYRLRRGNGRVSADLSIDDGPEEIQEAIQAWLTTSEIADGAELTVTRPASGTAHITFGGALAGEDEELITVEVVDAPVGDPTIVLPLTWHSLNTALRGKQSETFQLDLTWRLRDETAADDDLEAVYTVTGYRGPITIVPKLAPDNGLNVYPSWVRPTSPETYRPFSRDQIFFGSRHFISEPIAAFGTYVIPHNLDSEQLIVTAIDAGGLIRYESGVETSIVSPSAVEVTVGSPADLPVRILISTVGAEEHFLAHTHTLGDLPEVAALLAQIGARLTALENLLPSGSLTASDDTVAEIARWTLPTVSTVTPSRKPITIPETGILSLDTTKLRGGLLPAIHTTTAPADLPSMAVPPTEQQSGKVYRNVSGSSVIVPGGGGRPSASVPNNGLVGAAWDPVKRRGAWYPVALKAGTSSYYPSAFDLPLFELLVTAEQFRLRTRFRVEFGFDAAILKSSNRVRWQLLVEYGLPTAATSPGTPGPNLESITWDEANPAIDQTLYLGPTPTRHRIGLELERVLASGENMIKAEKSLYGARTVAGAPTAATFGIRARLARFDILDAPAFDGLLAVQGLNLPSGETDIQPGFAWIA